jgi:uncharacterized protein Veg
MLLAAKRLLSDIKRDLDGLIGERVRLRANRGRRKVDEREGILEKTYPSIFVVKIDEEPAGARRISFSYADVLTETVELEIAGDDGYHRLLAN